jgi:hypothetical protein
MYVTLQRTYYYMSFKRLFPCEMMGSQKVPGMVILRSNGRTYGNAYLIAFNVGVLRA